MADKVSCLFGGLLGAKLLQLLLSLALRERRFLELNTLLKVSDALVVVRPGQVPSGGGEGYRLIFARKRGSRVSPALRAVGGDVVNGREKSGEVRAAWKR